MTRVASTMLTAVVVMTMTGCKQTPSIDPAWKKKVEDFRAAREKSVGGEDGWVTLVALQWLDEGANALPGDAGTVFVDHGALRLATNPAVEVKADGNAVTEMPMHDDADGKPTRLESGSLRMHVVKRGDRQALRVKDRNAPARAAFKGLTWFPLDPRFKVTATLHRADAGETMPIDTVLRTTESQPTAGVLHFELDGAPQQLIALKDDGAGLFVIFKDQTSGSQTYPAGRYIDTAAPAADGTVELDFNTAYTPPCGFTSFATCPLPPYQNHLKLKVTAGETFSGH